MIEPNLPESIRKEAHTVRQMEASLRIRILAHNKKLRRHLKLLAQSADAAYVKIADGLAAKVVGTIGAHRVQVEDLAGNTCSLRLEQIEDCLTEQQFNELAAKYAKAERAKSVAAKERLREKD